MRGVRRAVSLELKRARVTRSVLWREISQTPQKSRWRSQLPHRESEECQLDRGMDVGSTTVGISQTNNTDRKHSSTVGIWERISRSEKPKIETIENRSPQTVFWVLLDEVLTDPSGAQNDRNSHKDESQRPGNPVEGDFRAFGTGEQLGLSANGTNSIPFGTVEHNQNN